ncbi:TlpA disulfide reductase family protein [Siccirubricoccus sp. G192]|uniref:TlpA family protein disulfide reductase n=1 Tax=Siccirubricoccus sp. G192 TaxID=2849651 RepID=UPI001C2C6A7C|nr:TlpA disulfide reductase family protein [Siccirubricoccus sp. G192]MBV1795791.1 TlpA family protein disulfide reductase [Siccirubricoccus sp. G192]
MLPLSLLPGSRRGLLARGLALAAAGTLQAGLDAGQARAASPGRLVESPPRPVPDLAFTDAEGKPHGLADFAGRGLVINLWATWCPPCVAEMPALDRAQAALAAEGVVVLALSSDRGGKAQVEPFYRERGIRHLGLWLDPRGAAQRALGVRGLPTSLILDREGRERARLEGAAEWDKPEMLAAIRRLVGPGAVPEQERT